MNKEYPIFTFLSSIIDGFISVFDSAKVYIFNYCLPLNLNTHIYTDKFWLKYTHADIEIYNAKDTRR